MEIVETTQTSNSKNFFITLGKMLAVATVGFIAEQGASKAFDKIAEARRNNTVDTDTAN